MAMEKDQSSDGGNGGDYELHSVLLVTAIE